MRPRFSRHCIASSRGAYVRKSHFLYVQEQLALRGTTATIEEIIEATTVIMSRKYYIRCFGKLKRITEKEARTLKSSMVVIL